MRACIFHKPFDLRIKDLNNLKPNDKEVLIRIKAASVCGTDFHIYQGKVDVETPIILGHDGAGVVEEMGKGVTSLKKG